MKTLAMLLALLATVPLFAQNAAYPDVHAKSIKDGKPLVVGIGCAAPSGDWATATVTKLDGYKAPCIVVAVPRKDYQDWKATLPPTATAADVRKVLSRPEVRAAVPFRPGEIALPDDDENSRSMPASVAEMMLSLTPYNAATMTQTTNRRVTGMLFPSLRSALELKWRVPGHMEGVRDWSSKLYKSDHQPKVFLARQEPFDSVAAVTWFREYPDGTKFMDVLRNGGGNVFEVRAAEKVAGKWDRGIIYRDIDARPESYEPPTRKQCAGCHQLAGVAVYGGAAVPGGDEVISDPYPILESGRSIQGGYGTQSYQ